MVSTQDFAHEVWVSLENIRERLAVVETEIKHARRDLMRLETNLQSHVDGCRGCHVDGRRVNGARGAGDDDAAVNVRFNRKLLGGSAAGAAAAGIAAAGRALGWW